MEIKTFLAAAVNIWQARPKSPISHTTLVPVKLQPAELFSGFNSDYFSITTNIKE